MGRVFWPFHRFGSNFWKVILTTFYDFEKILERWRMEPATQSVTTGHKWIKLNKRWSHDTTYNFTREGKSENIILIFKKNKGAVLLLFYEALCCCQASHKWQAETVKIVSNRFAAGDQTWLLCALLSERAVNAWSFRANSSLWTKVDVEQVFPVESVMRLIFWRNVSGAAPGAGRWWRRGGG